MNYPYEHRCAFHPAIKNKSKPWAFVLGGTLASPYLTYPHIPVSSLSRLAGLPQAEVSHGVLSCQDLHLNIIQPAGFKVQVSP